MVTLVNEGMPLKAHAQNPKCTNRLILHVRVFVWLSLDIVQNTFGAVVRRVQQCRTTRKITFAFE